MVFRRDIVLKHACALALTATALVSPAFANDAPPPESPNAPIHKDAPVDAKKAADPLWKPGLAGSILSSRFASQHQDVDEAAKYLTESLQRDPNNETLKQQAMRAQLIAGHMNEALDLAHSLQASAGNDPLVATLLMIDDVRQNKLDEAKQAIARPADRGLFGIIRPVMNEWVAIAGGGMSAPVSMQDAIDKSGFFAPFLHYHAALMNDVLGYGDIALQHYQKASSDPAVTPYRVVEALSNYYQRHGDPAKAQQVFDDYAKENPESSLIPDKLPGEADGTKVAPLVGNPSEGLAELFFATASILFGEDMTNESFIYLRLSLALRPDLAPAQLMLANLYEANQEYKQAIAIYDGIKPGTVFYKRARIRKALNVEAAGNVDDALNQLQSISTDYPKDETALITIGDIRREQARYDDAVQAYSDAMKRIGTLRNTDWPLLYARGVSYERGGSWDLAEKDFLAALKLQPNQPEVLNYLGYSWLVQHKNLKQAQDYISVALSARPEDAHIIDSMGWVYYTNGDYSKAVDTLERAAEVMPEDPTVNDHLGDAYWQAGRKTEAQYQWKRALGLKPEPADAERIKAKIADGMTAATTKPQTVGRNDTPMPNSSDRSNSTY